LATFILEDPTTLTCGMLVSDGYMRWPVAFLGLSLGIGVGDMGLYWIGRVLGPRLIRMGILSPPHVAKASEWMNRNLIMAVISARFAPGIRLPMYVGAGLLHASAVRFGLVAMGASVVWSGLLLFVTIQAGEALGRYKWPVLILVLLLLFGWRFIRKWIRKKEEPEIPSHKQPRAKRHEHVVSFFEFWPTWLFYIPLIFYYIWLALRYRSLTLFTVANPSIYAGGFIRESKEQIFALLPESQSKFMLRYVCWKKPDEADNSPLLVQSALKNIHEAGLDYPFIAKPDEGQRGAGVQCIRNEKQLADYIEAIPSPVPILFQELADYPHEAGVLYYRMPGEEQGHIFSLTLKEFPKVVGDGVENLRERILADPRACIISHIYFARHAERLDDVLADGEEFQLVFSGNHCRGAIFHNGNHLINPKLYARFHELATSMPDFYFGRFDVRFQDLEAFLEGGDFKIIEINGAGAEATHIWDSQMHLREAYATLFKQFRILFQISHRNRQAGHKPLGPRKMIHDLLAARRLLKQYPPTD
ncbi:MAG: VTT domain-containing protein, partial [Candidatus Sumerlaeota bacterium]